MQNIFAAICKVDDEQRMVYGYASTEALDVQGEIVTKEALAAALPEYMKFANIREMHQPSAVGVAKSAEIDEKGLWIGAKIVDDDAWKKVKEGVYKAFSIGGRTLEKVENVIKGLRLTEISLVDRPANPEAVIEVWKCDAEQPAVDTLAEMLNKGVITPERLVELAKADTAPPDAPEGHPEPVEKGEFEGEEVWDVARALQALDSILMLAMKEKSEDEAEPAQIEALNTAIAALKTFIVSEIQEDNSEKAEQGEDVAKAGRVISASNMQKIQAMHDQCATLGAKCAKEAEKADEVQDIAKAEEALAKLASLEKAVSDLSAERDTLSKRLAEMEAKPAPGKALLKAIAKGDDVIADHETYSAPLIKDGRGNANEVASLIKQIHQQGGVLR